MDVKKFGLIGSPVDHSISPNIHQLLAKYAGLDHISYEKIEILPENFEKSLSKLIQADFNGVNVTSPLKRQAFEFIDDLTGRAQHAGSVNTISINGDGYLKGDNTDGIGFVRDLTKNNLISVENKKILIIGAGGAARGIIRPLFSLEPKLIAITNRTKSKAQEIIKYFRPWGKVKLINPIFLKWIKFDIIINATSAGLDGLVPQFDLHSNLKDTVCVDLNYGKAAKPFLNYAKGKGAFTRIDGLGMLVEQAAESFYQWNNIRVDTTEIIKILSQQTK